MLSQPILPVRIVVASNYDSVNDAVAHKSECMYLLKKTLQQSKGVKGKSNYNAFTNRGMLIAAL